MQFDAKSFVKNSAESEWVVSYIEGDAAMTMSMGVDFERAGTKLKEILVAITPGITQYPYYLTGKDFFLIDKGGIDPQASDFTLEGTLELNEGAYSVLKTHFAAYLAESIDPGMAEQAGELLPAGGVYVKFQVTLPQAEVVSEITLTPFSSFPIELASIQYEEDIETFHSKKDLIPKNVTYSSTKTMVVSFNSVLVRRLTFVIRQKNYTTNTYLVRETEENKSDLWMKIANREMEVTLSTDQSNPSVGQADLDTYSGWDIYTEALGKHEQAMTEYTEKLAKYNANYEVYKQSLADWNQRYG